MEIRRRMRSSSIAAAITLSPHLQIFVFVACAMLLILSCQSARSADGIKDRKLHSRNLNSILQTCSHHRGITRLRRPSQTFTSSTFFSPFLPSSPPCFCPKNQFNGFTPRRLRMSGTRDPAVMLDTCGCSMVTF